MIPICLCTALLLPSAPQEQPLTDAIRVFEIGHLTGASELSELRAAIIQDDLPVSVRRASLDRYTTILKSGTLEAKAKELASSIEHFVEPAAGPGFRVEPLSASELSVTGLPAQVDWVAEFLRQTAKTNLLGAMVDIRVEIYRLPAGHREALTGGRSGAAMSPKELLAVETKLATIQGVEKVNSPRMRTFVAQEGEISVVNETAYVRDYQLTILPDLKQEVLDPVVDVVSEGFSIKVRALGAAGGGLLVSTEFSSSSLHRPIAEIKSKLGPNFDEVTIQLPEVKIVKGSAKFELQDDAGIVLSTIDPGFDDETPEDLLVIVRAELVLPQGENASGK